LRNLGIEGFKDSRIQGFRDLGIEEFRDLGLFIEIPSCLRRNFNISRVKILLTISIYFNSTERSETINHQFSIFNIQYSFPASPG